MGSPDEIPDRKPKINKEPGLFYGGKHFMKFLGRFKRTALAFKASDYNKALQIGWFVRSEELKVQLEAMDGYNEYDWKTLQKSMVNSWGELDNTILYTNHDLSQVTEDLRKNWGLKNYREYKTYPGKFTPILKYLVENGHLHRKEEASRLFLSAFSPEKAEFEIRAEKNGGFSATNFAEANYQMQISLSQQKGGSQQRDRMLEELPTSKAVDKQVSDMAQDVASLKQQLQSLLPNHYNNSGTTQQDYSCNNKRPSTPGNEQSEFSRPRERPLTPLFKSQLCFYCHRELHYTSRCPDAFKDEELGLIMEVAEKLAKSRKVAFTGILQPQVPPVRLREQTRRREEGTLGFRTWRTIEWTWIKNAKRRNVLEKLRGPYLKREHVKLPTTFAQLTAIAPSYTKQVIAKLQERLHGKSSATYMANEHTKVSSAMMTPHEESDPTDPCYYSCALGYVLAKVGEGKVDFIIDSGSMVNVIPRSVAEDLDLEVVQINIPMKGIGGARCDITGVVENCQINIGRFSGPAHLFVSPKAQDCILGRPFLSDYGCTLEYHEEGETLSFKGSKGRQVSVPLARIGHGKGWNNKKDLGTNNFRPRGNIDQPSQEHWRFKKKTDQSFL
ncbi:hypothetical protein PSTG_01183 [Puccinia striiformis f. sp. tritici PST-78]|uniref:Peptidase A2 domain-containing protein n=1 Tax=Puccinia striiformis f. sp. tritici PST-78 TaxID=1165861 RepID=A0A0L0W2Q0_9BASI|nr:hypothetical protein PSTG_01183 [Puccinia striiformis f. sp. tritici PST-78]